MNIWELLGIPPTTDTAKIKSAYARQAKLYHPEEHPEEFKALQNAYKMAIRIAKSQKAASSYVPPVQPPEGSADEPGMEAEASADMPRIEPEIKVSADRPETEAETSFDYSDVDAYGDRERFFTQFKLLVKNPYLRNNLDAWDEFLDQKEYRELFANNGFRMNFVRTMCRQSGWRRKTVLYFERYLEQFHTDKDRPADGRWETQLTSFRIKKLPRFRLPAFFMDRYWGKEGAAFHKKLRSRLSHFLGRELNFDIKADVVRYMKLYLFFGESSKANEDFIGRLHRKWVIQQTALVGIILTVCFVVVLGQIHAAEERKAEENQLEYIRELYDLDFDTYSVEGQRRELREYNDAWERAEEGIDDVLNRYEKW